MPSFSSTFPSSNKGEEAALTQPKEENPPSVTPPTASGNEPEQEKAGEGDVSSPPLEGKIQI